MLFMELNKINKDKAKVNIEYINRIKSQLNKKYSFDHEKITNIIKLEKFIFGDKNIENFKKLINQNVSEQEYQNIFEIQEMEYYPSEAQAESFVFDEVCLGEHLSDNQIKLLKEKYIHAWQVPRDTETPSLELLITLIDLYKESSEDLELLSKLSDKLVS